MQFKSVNPSHILSGLQFIAEFSFCNSEDRTSSHLGLSCWRLTTDLQHSGGLCDALVKCVGSLLKFLELI